jgi:hypothetical protein
MSSFSPRWMMDSDFERNGYEHKQKFIYTCDGNDNKNKYDKDDDKYYNVPIYKNIHIYIGDVIMKKILMKSTHICH